jgi:endonuclease III
MRPALDDVIDRLEKQYGRPKPPRYEGVFEAVVAENAAYLVDDERRQTTVASLRKRVGITPEALLRANKAELVAAIAEGGMLAAGRAQKLVKAATIARELGDLDALARRPLAEARRALKRFPGFGGAAVDKLLMMFGGHRVLALDSNGLRVLTRLGFGREGNAYAQQYRDVQAAIAPELPKTAARLQRAHALLRVHGQQICRTTKPACNECALSSACPSRRHLPKPA